MTILSRPQFVNVASLGKNESKQINVHNKGNRPGVSHFSETNVLEPGAQPG